MVRTTGLWAPLMARVASILRWAAGPSQVILDTSVDNHVSSVSATSIHGHDLTISCRAVYFHRVFQRAFMPKRRMAVYSISATVSADAPPRLQEGVSDFSVNIPRECGCLISEPQQKQLAVEAYLDLLLAKLDRRQSERFL